MKQEIIESLITVIPLLFLIALFYLVIIVVAPLIIETFILSLSTQQ